MKVKVNSQDFEGDKMFVDRKGNEMLADVKFRIHKSNCGGTELKAKKDDKKKPAHGMVIVIGSKAGPGPSKDGKREKLDSEKKDESD